MPWADRGVRPRHPVNDRTISILPSCKSLFPYHADRSHFILPHIEAISLSTGRNYFVFSAHRGDFAFSAHRGDSIFSSAGAISLPTQAVVSEEDAQRQVEGHLKFSGEIPDPNGSEGNKRQEGKGNDNNRNELGAHP